MLGAVVLVIVAMFNPPSSSPPRCGPCRRPGPRMGVWGRFSKWLTHRAERRQARRLAKQAEDAAQARLNPDDPFGYDL